MAILKITTTIIEKNPDNFLVECGSCNGKGRYLRDTSYRCKVCDGSGTIMLRIPPDWNNLDIALVKCGSCDGNGRYLRDKSYRCKTCDGVGVLVKAFPRVSCGSCDGKGRYLRDTSYRCKVCDGGGSIWIENINKM